MTIEILVAVKSKMPIMLIYTSLATFTSRKISGSNDRMSNQIVCSISMKAVKAVQAVCIWAPLPLDFSADVIPPEESKSIVKE
jgi:hypothetical protein